MDYFFFLYNIRDNNLETASLIFNSMVTTEVT